ncbi:iron-sulfur cluster assembly accessory protein [Roseomonas sp. NAR14]|uniref:Iron-sulfur cluster assembly accessory protein n=1 Tax=Roseomonas acroporae TaxID=2937791 RepID=A0A9X2BWF4_9PROT|nr:iron-sulfur cluster assembly accessory protein [Roseomonas acroporae]MCK8783825.1 iron-sulfur cluster assembly accessory protein [Roseomonas acroporae]
MPDGTVNSGATTPGTTDRGATGPAPFQVTGRAAAQVAEIAAREGRPGAGLRVGVSAGGCSGFQYTFALEDAAQPDDLVIEAPPVRVFVDPVSLDLLAGSELDWADELIGAHFTVRNPQAVSGCGCGASFSIG